MLSGRSYRKNIPGEVAMIGGIFETISKTLGVGKEKYFIELDDAAEESVEKAKTAVAKTAKAAVETAKDVSADVVDTVQSVTGDVADSASSAADKAAGKAASKAKTATDKTAQQAAKAAKAPVEKAKVKKLPAAGQTEGAEQVDTSAPAKSESLSPDEIIVNAIAAASKKNSEESAAAADGSHTFATDHLMPLGNRGRRRPGPSLGAFKGMAKEVNPRLKR